MNLVKAHLLLTITIAIIDGRNCQVLEGCFVPGECVQSPFLEVTVTSTPEQCLLFCQVRRFTFYYISQDKKLLFQEHKLVSHSWLTFLEWTTFVLGILCFWIHKPSYWINYCETVCEIMLFLISSQEFPGCSAFTHHGDSEGCFAWESCNFFSEETCSDCTSGLATCTASVSAVSLYHCFSSGEITSTSISN